MISGWPARTIRASGIRAGRKAGISDLLNYVTFPKLCLRLPNGNGSEASFFKDCTIIGTPIMDAADTQRHPAVLSVELLSEEA